MIYRLVVILSLVMVLVVPVSPVVAQQAQEDVPSEQEILSIVNNGFESQMDDVRAWLESDRSNDYPELRSQAQGFINDVEESNQEAQEDLSGTKRISDNVQVVGYQFDELNETVEIAVEADERTTIVLQDLGGTVGGSGFSYRTETVVGVERFTLEAQEEQIGNRYSQAISIADADAQQGNTIFRDSPDSGGLFRELEWWMIPLAAISGAGSIVIMIIRHIRNKEQLGVNEFIPLE
ncbi:hypothetical protein BDK61_2864 [Haloarcula quadrata]|uniref:Uncharacterized protein n=1 Tax=Haloarcula quadrata TaxID=182779 RepID=A0A495R899_9EURY|nr:hypothetical protein [Haloarcula quadrata]RKS83479.1 hypothetical protein BDK61_2864 [Haloarcula quadrata]